MTRWEYLTVQHVPDHGFYAMPGERWFEGAFDEWFNTLGADGWDLVFFRLDPAYAVFKRPVVAAK